MVTRFLGRAPTNDAFFAEIRGQREAPKAASAAQAPR
jgi:hypothetical protein